MRRMRRLDSRHIFRNQPSHRRTWPCSYGLVASSFYFSRIRWPCEPPDGKPDELPGELIWPDLAFEWIAGSYKKPANSVCRLSISPPRSIVAVCCFRQGFMQVRLALFLARALWHIRPSLRSFLRSFVPRKGCYFFFFYRYCWKELVNDEQVPMDGGMPKSQAQASVASELLVNQRLRIWKTNC